mgnify:CR=1 FL=1
MVDLETIFNIFREATDIDEDGNVWDFERDRGRDRASVLWERARRRERRLEENFNVYVSGSVFGRAGVAFLVSSSREDRDSRWELRCRDEAWVRSVSVRADVFSDVFVRVVRDRREFEGVAGEVEARFVSDGRSELEDLGAVSVFEL